MFRMVLVKTTIPLGYKKVGFRIPYPGELYVSGGLVRERKSGNEVLYDCIIVEKITLTNSIPNYWLYFPGLTFVIGIALLLLGLYLSLQIEPTFGDIPMLTIVTGSSSIAFGLGWIAKGEENDFRRSN